MPSLQRHTPRLVVAAGAALLVVAVVRAQGPGVAVAIYDRAEAVGSALTLTAGKSTCAIGFAGKNAYVPACTLAVGADAATVALGGLIVGKDDRGRPQRAKGQQSWRVADLTPLLGPMRDRSQPFSRRLQAFAAAKTAFEARFADLDTMPLSFDETEKATDAAIRGAEARLGYALPPEHVTLLRDLGELEIGDSATESATTVTNAWDTMLKGWGTPLRALEQETSPPTRALFKASALLFTEVGDGLGGLLYRPRDTACGGVAAFYAVHQDEIDEPQVLRAGPDGPCVDYTDAMLWLLRMQALLPYEGADSTLLFIDRSAPAPVAVRLERRHGERFEFSLTPVWAEWR